MVSAPQLQQINLKGVSNSWTKFKGENAVEAMPGGGHEFVLQRFRWLAQVAPLFREEFAGKVVGLCRYACACNRFLCVVSAPCSPWLFARLHSFCCGCAN